MKRLSLCLITLLMFFGFNANLLASKKAIIEKLKIVIPKVKFDDQSVADAFAFIVKMSRELDVDKKASTSFFLLMQSNRK